MRVGPDEWVETIKRRLDRRAGYASWQVTASINDDDPFWEGKPTIIVHGSALVRGDLVNVKLTVPLLLLDDSRSDPTPLLIEKIASDMDDVIMRTARATAEEPER